MNQREINKLDKALKKKDTKWLRAREKELEPLREEYYLISHILDDRHKEEEQKKKWARRHKLVAQTDFVECDYPYMGSVADNGRATFKSRKQAEDLVDSLREGSGYMYGYWLEWSGKGEYIVEPSYSHDHDGDVIYTATFKKSDE